MKIVFYALFHCIVEDLNCTNPAIFQELFVYILVKKPLSLDGDHNLIRRCISHNAFSI